MNDIVRIAAAVLDTAKLTLYLMDGSTIVLQQGDLRIRHIIDEATPQILKQGFADINLAMEVGNPYRDFEEKSTRVSLFRIAKDKLKNLFGIRSSEPEVTEAAAVGTIPKGKVDVAVSVTPTVPQVTTAAIEEIMAHAKPVSAPDFNEVGLNTQAPITDGNGFTPNDHTSKDSPDTIIAVVDGDKIIPGVEKIKTQFKKAADLGSTIGVENFLARVGKVIQKRTHSIEDLLTFMERGDLPIADDGSILIYKVLNRNTNVAYPLAKYFDCHTGNVPQWVGARVCMSENLVDPNRNNECSTGLHVARRGYVRSFGGSVCVMAKLAPEDVITVPTYDANKMRVCGYDILFELTDKQFSLLRLNKPITDDEAGKILLAKALKGDHTKVTHIVKITGPKGAGIQITDLSVPTPEPKKKTPIVPVTALPDGNEKADPVEPKQVMKEVETMKETITPVIEQEVKSEPETSIPVEQSPSKPESYSQRIAKLAAITPMDLQTAQAILDIKKKAKKGWDVLKVDEKIVAQVLKLTEPKQ